MHLAAEVESKLPGVFSLGLCLLTLLLCIGAGFWFRRHDKF